MRHRPFFRWVLTLGVLVFGWSAYLYSTASSAIQQVDLTVISEKHDGQCTVRWKDPYHGGGRLRESAYHCDPDRDAILKAPGYDPDTGYGWDTGFIFTEGPHKGDLEPSQLDRTDPYALSDALVLIGLALIAVGLVGGNIRGSVRLAGARPKTVARARKLHEAADQVVRDHAQACDAVRVAWEALRREQIEARLRAVPVARLIKRAAVSRAVQNVEAAGVRTARDVLEAGVLGLAHMGADRRSAERIHAAARRRADNIEATLTVRVDPVHSGPCTVALLVALHVLLEAGAGAHRTAGAGAALATELERALTDAEPASGYRSMLGVSREQREIARSAVSTLQSLMAGAERDGLPAQFAQTSVDLLRVPDDPHSGVSARADFESSTGQYYRLLAQVVDQQDTLTGH
ncbi:hypothetical protein OG217_20645 [Streptomyces sp. NBC_01023]|uniref:hypothetical protein n=1 Tax=Streptomyces sp. NBC_01023 TaxID=2903724 RepID=UPI00386E2C1B|nr:hypothetical protein OG217_20645 [Streptomyces sp. NBC_01023]